MKLQNYYLVVFVCVSVISVRCQITKKDAKEETPTSPESRKDYALKHLLPSKNYCGLQNPDDYSHDSGTTETTVDELPWVAFLSCDDGPIASSIATDSEFAVTSRGCDCSGVLISNQYVLTASNCASAKWVGLGQREQHQNISCTATPYGNDCSEALATTFSEKIRHPNNTLLLLRLSTKIVYTDYIRPICLPLEENGIKIGETVTSSKWNIDSRARDFVRAKLNHTITTNDECSQNFRLLDLQNSPSYVCTEIDDDVAFLCKTDSGAPMMYNRNINWFLGGILHSEICTDKTAVGNLITPEVVNWILENMKP